MVRTRGRGVRQQVTPGTVAFRDEGLGRTAILGGLVALVLIGLVTNVARGSAAAAYPSELETAARTLEAATADGGSGYQFDVLQRQDEYRKAGGPPIAIPDPANPRSIIARVDHLYVNAALERGRVAPRAFWMEMRLGPDEHGTPNFDTSPSLYGAIQTDHGLWRNDGQGWFPTGVSPGIGMDPTTASLLPHLLRNVTDLKDLGTAKVTGSTLRHFTGVVGVADFPGVIASDGASFTESPIAVDLWLDTSNRLVKLDARTRNLNEPDVDLKVVTTISFSYVAVGPVPDPVPLAPSPSVTGATVGQP